jgi:adenosylcobinamide-GDP ribazoletransferase
MHGKWRSARLAVAFFLTLAFSMAALQINGLVVILAGLLLAAIMLVISKKELGGLTGDAMGATNELVRLASLLVVLVIPRWL